MWEDYTVPGGTYRENLLNTPGHPTVPEGHPARNFRYDVLKEKYGDENGDIIIDRRGEKKPADQAPAPAPAVETEKLDIKEGATATTRTVEVSV